jgi:hypothetical protein
MTTEANSEERRISGFESGAKASEILGIQPGSLGQSYPQHYPQAREALGEPLSIRQVAQLIGCSAWTVRHRYLPRGLPHLRSGPMGKLVFYRDQVIQWILQQQKKGGR